VVLKYYEPTDSVRQVILENSGNDNQHVTKYEKEWSIIVVDTNRA
jgi:hypothetical protein